MKKRNTDSGRQARLTNARRKAPGRRFAFLTGMIGQLQRKRTKAALSRRPAFDAKIAQVAAAMASLR